MFKNLNYPLAAFLGFTAALPLPSMAQSEPPANWVTSWFASPQPLWGADFILPTNIPGEIHGQSVREVVKISAGGRRVRLVFSNRYGTTPLTIGEVHLALSQGGPKIVNGTDRLVTFGGQTSVTVAPGAPIVSDSIDLPLDALQQVTVTTFFPNPTKLTTFHWGDQQTAYLSTGNVTNLPTMSPESEVKGRLFLTSLLVDATPAVRTVVALGDSLTDGNGSTPTLNRRWPDYLAQRLSRNQVAVANAGISGAKLLGEKMGVNAAARFEQDVLSQPGVKAVVLLMGINDIGWPGSAFAPNDKPLKAEELVNGYRQLAASAHAHNIRIVGATLPPFEGALHGTPLEGHYSAEKDRVRQEVNRWIRTGGAFDAVVDFDFLLRDPAHPSRLLPAYDSGDHLHPGDIGYRTMANAIDMHMLFGKTPVAVHE